jgi:hypothetical protein
MATAEDPKKAQIAKYSDKNLKHVFSDLEHEDMPDKITDLLSALRAQDDGRRQTMTNLDPRDELVTHLPALRAFALSLTRNRFTADDMMQDTMLKAWANMDKFNPGTNMQAWLFTILRNNFYSSRRTLNREVADVDNFFSNRISAKPDHDRSIAIYGFQIRV